MRQAGIEVNRIEMLNGCLEFCQEYMTDVFVPDTDRVGEVDGGWTVGTRWMFHERMLYNSPYVSAPKGMAHGGSRGLELLDLARKVGRIDDPLARDLIGEGRMLELAQKRCSTGSATASCPGGSTTRVRRSASCTAA